MQVQLRIYKIRPGTIDEFVANWRIHMIPVRQKMGFKILGAWTGKEPSEFVWMVAYVGEGDFAEGERAYYASPERHAIAWDPMPYIEKMEIRLLDTVEAGF